MDAFLQSVSGPGPSIKVPVVPPLPRLVPGVNPHKYDVTIPIPPAALVVPAPGVFLYRLYATLRWALAGPVVRVAGRAEGPLIEFYRPV